MKRTLLSLSTLFLAFSASAQTATNFVGNDCASNPHDFFAEMNSGKVLVLTWVTPNAASVTTAQAAFGAVQMFSFSNPGQVFLYIIDDFGDTPCATLTNWANANSIGSSTMFSNAAIDMTDYGTAGAQKTVVIGGGWNHLVYFNQNNSAAANSTAIENAIDSALAMITAVPAPIALTTVELFPNPSAGSTTLTINAAQASETNVSVYDMTGKEVMSVYKGAVAVGETRIAISTADLAEGVYFVRVSDAEGSRVVRMIVSR